MRTAMLRKGIVLLLVACLVSSVLASCRQAGRRAAPRPRAVRPALPPERDWLADLKDPHPAVRFLACHHAHKRGQEAVPLLTAALHDSDPRVQLAAIHALGRLGPQAAAASENLVELLVLEPEGWKDTVGAPILAALDRIGPASEGPLRSVIVRLPHWKRRREEIVRRLLTGNQESISAIARAFAQDIAYGHPPDVPAALDALVTQQVAVLAEHGTRDQRIRALRALVRRAGAPTDLFLRALRDPELEVRRTAVVSVVELGLRSSEVAAAFLQATHDPDLDLRRKAFHALPRILPDALERLLATIAANDMVDSEYAAEALGSMGEDARPAAQRLVRMIREWEEFDRRGEAILRDANAGTPLFTASSSARWAWTALVGMVRESPPSAMEIRELLTDKRPLVRFAGALVLDQAEVTSPELVPLIAPIAEDPEAIVRSAALRALERTSAVSDRLGSVLVLGVRSGPPAWREHSADLLARRGRPAVAPLLAMLKSPSVEVRSAAVSALGRLGVLDDQARTPLVAAVSDSDVRVRVAAIRALSELATRREECARLLVDLLGDVEWRVSSSSADGLVRLGAVSVPALVDVVCDASVSIEWRQRAVHILGELPPGSDAEAARLLEAAVQEELAYNIGVALGEAGKPAIAAVVAGLRHASASVRSSAARALESICLNERNKHNGRPTALLSESAEELRSGTEDASPDVRRAAVKALRYVGPAVRVAIRQLEAALWDRDGSVRLAAAGTLLVSGDAASGALQGLLIALEDPDWLVCNNAAGTIANLGPKAEGAVPGLLEVLRKGTAEAPNDVLAALRCTRHRSKEAARVVGECLRDPRLRQAALDALLGMEDEAKVALPRILEALDDEYAWPTAVRLLGRFGPDAAPAVPKLIALMRRRALDDPTDDSSRPSSALVSIGEASIKDLAMALTDWNSGLRIQAVETLKRMGPLAAGARERLEVALDQGDWRVRCKAARLLLGLGLSRERAHGVLLRDLEASDPYTRGWAACFILEHDKDPAVRFRAVGILVTDNCVDFPEELPAVFQGLGDAAVELLPDILRALDSTKVTYVSDRNRAMMIRLLAVLGPMAASAVPRLAYLAGDRHVGLALVSEALAAIGAAAEPSTLVIVEGLRDENAWVRREAAEALGRLGWVAQSAVSALEEARNDTDDLVREAAAAALRRIRESDAR